MAESLKPEHERLRQRMPDAQAFRLHEISEAIYRVAAGDFKVDLPLSPELDEIDAIARGVSMLAEEVGGRVRDLEHYRDLVENQAVGISLLDERECFLFANQAAHLVFGVPDGNLVGRNLRELTSEDGFRLVLEQTELRKRGERSTYELEIARPDGTRRVIRITSNPRFDSWGHFRGALGIFSDITEYKLTEEREKSHLRDMSFLSETAMAFISLSPEEDIYHLIGTKLQALVDDAFVFIVSYEESRDKVRLRTLLGREKELLSAVSILGWEPLEMEFPIDRALRKRLFHSGLVRLTGGLHELMNPILPGEMWARFSESFNLGELYAMAIKRRKDIFGAVVILTRGESRVDNPDLVEAFIYQAAVALQHRQAEEALRESELKLRRITETMQDIIGQIDINGIYRHVSASCRDITGYEPEELLGHLVLEFIHPDDLATVTTELAAAREAMRTGKVEYRGLHADGHYIWLETLGNPLLDENGELLGAIFSTRDITERKKREREIELMNQELKAYDHTVSHDLKAPLGSVKVAVQLLKSIIEAPDRGQHSLEDVVWIIDRNIEKVTTLLDGLLELAEMGQIDKNVEDVDLGEVVREVLFELAGTSYGTAYRMNDLGRLQVNPIHIYQLFSNLIHNALKYADAESPEISILKTGEHRYMVRDNGAGIPDQLESTLFLPFVKGEDGNRGLGLSIVKKIVETYGGEIEAHNDGGACFEFSLFDFEPSADT